MTDPSTHAVVPPTEKRDYLLPDRVYDILKWVAMILLPAVGALFGTVGLLWGVDDLSAILGTIVAVDTFLGAILQISTTSYQNSENRFDGRVTLTPAPEDQLTDVRVTMPNASELQDKKEVTLKVHNHL